MMKIHMYDSAALMNDYVLTAKAAMFGRCFEKMDIGCCGTRYSHFSPGWPRENSTDVNFVKVKKYLTSFPLIIYLPLKNPE